MYSLPLGQFDGFVESRGENKDMLYSVGGLLGCEQYDELAAWCFSFVAKFFAIASSYPLRQGVPVGKLKLRHQMKNYFMPAYIESGNKYAPHWRNPHFRRYPLRPDGTRRDGIVFVSGCVVGADMDNKTLEQSRSA